jgi:iron complex outermembrane recepter protein
MKRQAIVTRDTLLSAVGALVVAAPGSTLAQSIAASSDGSRLMEEVVVTATKRSESVMDVPISITAITTEEIDQRGFVSAQDYLRGIPGVNQTEDPVGSSIIIRGLETSPSFQNFSSGTTVATYFGETPTTNSAGLAANTNVDIKLVDIERVEVLRGPQGTSFGNSSLGGAVRTIPVPPNLAEFEGKVSGGLSETSGYGSGNHMLQGVINVPLMRDTLAIRATAYQFEDSGIYYNNASTDPVIQAAAEEYGAEAYANNEDDVGRSKFTGGRVSALYQPTEDFTISLMYLSQKTEIDGNALANNGKFTQAVFGVDPQHRIRGQTGAASDMDIEIVNLTMEYDFGWASLLATYSDLESGALNSSSFSQSNPIWPLSYLQDGDHDENSFEVRLTSQLEGSWNYLVGVYAEELDDDALFDYRWQGSDPDTALFPPDTGVYEDDRNLEQKAAFGEVSWKFLEGFTFTGGGRFYDYTRKVTIETSGVFFGDDLSNLETDASGNTFKANLSYAPNEKTLLYATWSEGFRLGKPQPGLPAGACDTDNDGIVDGSNVPIESTRALESDEVENYEIGGKFALLENRLIMTADIYRINWDGVPFRAAAPDAPDGCGFTYNANAGSAQSEGIEFQANWYVTDALRVDFGASSIDAQLSEDAPLLDGRKGDRLPGSPEFNANFGLQYAWALAGRDAYVRADSIYVGEFYGDLQQSEATKAGDYIKIDLNGRVAITDSLDLDLYVTNLTDEDAYTFRGTFDSGRPDFGFLMRPRTIGMRLHYSF